MALEQMRRFIFVFSALALFFATVLPTMSVNSGDAVSHYMGAMVTMDEINCPKCTMAHNKMVGCVQAICLGAAVVTDSNILVS